MNGSSGGTSGGKAIAPPPTAEDARYAKSSLNDYADLVAGLSVAIDSGTLPTSAVNNKEKLHLESARMAKRDLELLLRLHKEADKEVQAHNLDYFRALPSIVAAFGDLGKNRRPPSSAVVSGIKRKLAAWERERVQKVEAVANEARDKGAPQASPTPCHSRPC